jgi:hypothetical protein
VALLRNPSAVAQLYQVRAHHLRSHLTSTAVARFDALPTWSEPDLLAEPMAALSTAAQVTQTRLLVSMSSYIVGSRVATPPLDTVTGDAVRGGSIVNSWRIPFYSLWQGFTAGLSQAALVQQGRDDVVTQAVTDLSLSQRSAMSAIGQQRDDIIGYWRVPSPGSACEFCTEIADQLYHTEDLMPVHPGCECTVEPAIGTPAEADLGDEG